MATNYKPLVRKLQTALGMKGRVTRITQLQVYSEKAGKTVKKYVVAEKTAEGYRNFLATFAYPDVVKMLGAMYQKDDVKRVRMTWKDGTEQVFDNVDAAAAYADVKDTTILLHIIDGKKDVKGRVWAYVD